MEINSPHVFTNNSQGLLLELDSTNMEKYRTLVLSTGVYVRFDDVFMEQLTNLCIQHDVLQPNYRNEEMPQYPLFITENPLNIKSTKEDMEEILRWMRRVIYEKTREYTSEEQWLRSAPEWLRDAASRLHLRPAENLPHNVQKLTLSREAARALLTRVQDTRMNLQDPVLQLIWEGVCRSPMAKLNCLLSAGDRPGISGILTDIEWSIVDLVILYSDEHRHPVVTDESLKVKSLRLPLVATLEVVRAHALDESVDRSELARRWGRAYYQYTDKGFHTSLVVLQRRWHELRELARGAGGTGSAGGVSPGPAADLLARVDNLAPSDFSWTDLVAAGMVFTMLDVMENEIISETPGWTQVCKMVVSVAEKPRLADIDDVTEINKKLNHIVKDYVENERVAVDDIEAATAAATETNNYKLPVKTGRISSLILFESDEDEPSTDNANVTSEDDTLKVSAPVCTILKVETAVTPTVKNIADITPAIKLKEEKCTVSTSPKRKKPLLENASHIDKVTTPPIQVLVKPEPKEILQREVKIEIEMSESLCFDSINEEDSFASEINESSDYVTYKGEIDPKLLMDVKVLVERLEVPVYRHMRRAVSPVLSGDSEDESSRDSGSVWAADSGGSGSCSSSDGEGRRVTLRDIDEVRRRAMRKLTAQVAPVAPLAPLTPLTLAELHTPAAPPTPLPQDESDTREDQPILVDDVTQNITGASRVMVEVTKYDPLGVKTTRLRYGQGKYRREMKAVAADTRKRIKEQRSGATAQKKKKRLADSKKSPDETPKSADDDMSEWIRQRNLNAQYFGPPPPLPVVPREGSQPTTPLAQDSKKSKNSQIDCTTSSPPDTALTPVTISPSIPKTSQRKFIFVPIGPTKPNNPATFAQTSTTVIDISSALSGLNEFPSLGSSTPTTPVQYEKLATLDPSIASALTQASMKQIIKLPDGGSLIPVKLVTLPQTQGVSAENISPKNNTDITPTILEVGENSQEGTSIAMDIVPASSSIVQESETKPCDGVEPSSLDRPMPALIPIIAPASLPEIYGNNTSVSASEYVKTEDGSRLKVICKDRSEPFWVIGGEYLVLSEEPTDRVMLHAMYYTLSPPGEIKRIVLEPPRDAEQPRRGHTGSLLLSAPACMCVQGKVYRKLSSAPLRYAQVLYAVRSVQHARRALRAGAPLLVYNARRRHLAPMLQYANFLDVYDKAPEQIIIDE